MGAPDHRVHLRSSVLLALPNRDRRWGSNAQGGSGDPARCDT